MLRAVKLDCYVFLSAIKIQNIWTYAVLPFKF